MMFPEMEIILCSWIQTQWQFGLAVSGKMIKNMAKSIQLDLDPKVSFTASNGWYAWFYKWNNFTIWRRSSVNQSNPGDIVYKVLRFLIYFRSVKEKFPNAVVWACDETPILFDQVNWC